MKELIGRRFRSIYISDDKHVLVFIDRFNECVCYRAIGECCSETWFEEIINPEVIIGNRIIGIEEKGIIDNDLMQTYGYTLKTSRGYCDIVYRNLSNGEYSGSCSYRPEAILVESQNPINLSILNSLGLKIKIRTEEYIKYGGRDPIEYEEIEIRPVGKTQP